MATKSNAVTKPAARPLPPIHEHTVRSLDRGEAFDDELDPLGVAGADASRPPNRYEARPPNRYEARPPNRYEARPPNRYEHRAADHTDAARS